MASNTSRTQGLEKELKYLLTKDDYQRLIVALKPAITKTVYHHNVYFDDDQLRLRKKRFGLRLRFLDGKRAIVTLKHPAKAKGPKVRSLKIRHEYEEDIPYRLAENIVRRKAHLCDLKILPIKVLKRHFPKEFLSKIRPLGGVNTVRTFVRHAKNLELELDSFEMFHQKHYELEVETTKPKRADQDVKELLRAVHIPYHPISKSKLGRFIQEWRRRHP